MTCVASAVAPFVNVYGYDEQVAIAALLTIKAPHIVKDPKSARYMLKPHP
jgi:hypothetical protein